jgi:hypothetical protein
VGWKWEGVFDGWEVGDVSLSVGDVLRDALKGMLDWDTTSGLI